MKIWQRSMGIVLLILALMVSLPVWTQADTGMETLRAATRNAEAMQLAHERYHFEQWFESKFGYDPIFCTSGCWCETLFPFGRADRAYVLLMPGYYGDTDGKYRVYCFQWVNGVRKSGGYKMVYYADLIEWLEPSPQSRRSRRARPIRSIIDYLNSQIWFQTDTDEVHSCGFTLKRSVRRYARRDLALKRDCVRYATSPMVGEDALLISVISEAQSNVSPSLEMLSWDYDPLTGSRSGYEKRGADGSETATDKFFRVYGLPVVGQELTLLR